MVKVESYLKLRDKGPRGRKRDTSVTCKSLRKNRDSYTGTDRKNSRAWRLKHRVTEDTEFRYDGAGKMMNMHEATSAKASSAQ